MFVAYLSYSQTHLKKFDTLQNNYIKRPPLCSECMVKKKVFSICCFYVFVFYDALPREEIISIPYRNLIILLTTNFNSHCLTSYT